MRVYTKCFEPISFFFQFTQSKSTTKCKTPIIEIKIQIGLEFYRSLFLYVVFSYSGTDSTISHFIEINNWIEISIWTEGNIDWTLYTSPNLEFTKKRGLISFVDIIPTLTFDVWKCVWMFDPILLLVFISMR